MDTTSRAIGTHIHFLPTLLKDVINNKDAARRFSHFETYKDYKKAIKQKLIPEKLK
jgi:hypothetical protein